MCQYLCEHGADITENSNSGFSALGLAKVRGRSATPAKSKLYEDVVSFLRTYQMAMGSPNSPKRVDQLKFNAVTYDHDDFKSEIEDAREEQNKDEDTMHRRDSEEKVGVE